MANITAKDGAGNAVQIAASGDGSSISPFVRRTEVTNFPATQPVSGSVSIENFPATQPVSGSVNVGNFPSTQAVSGSVSITNQPAFAFDANGNLRVNFPATQAVSGSVSVSNFPATQPVSGTVSIGNFPATQAISAASLPLPAGAATEVTLATISGKLPASLGTKIATESLAVTLSSDGLFAQAFGTKNDNTAGMDTALVSFISLFKRLLSVKLPANLGGKTAAESFPVTLAADGALVSAIGTRADAAATSDTATDSSLIGFFKRLLSIKLPSALVSDRFKVDAVFATPQRVDVAAIAPANIKRAPITASTSGDVSIIAGVTGQKVKVIGMMLVANGDVNVIIKSGTTNLSGSIPLASKGNGFVLPQNFLGYHWFEGVDAGNLALNLSAAIAVTGFLIYAQEA